MPEKSDWAGEIKRHLKGLRLSAGPEPLIIEELSQHIDDQYGEALLSGMPADKGRSLTLQELSGHELLKQELRRLERWSTPEPIVFGSGRKNMIGNLWQDFRYG